jgi:hypothetical protein
MKGIGRLVSWGFAKETTRGTAVSAASYWSAFDDLDFDEKADNVTHDAAVGVVEDSVAQYRVKNYADGSFKAHLTDQSAGPLFYSIFGGYAHAAHSGETTVYDHTFTVGESAQHQSLTFFIHDPLGGTDYSHANGVVHKMDLDAQLKKFVQLSLSCRAQKGVTQTAFTPSIVAENVFIPQYMTFKYATTVAGLGSATAIQLKSLKLSIDESIEDQEVLGSVAPADYLNKEFKVSGTLECIYQNLTDFKSVFLATPNVPQAMSIALVNTDVNIGVVPSHPTLAITLDQVYFTELGIKKSPKDLTYQVLKFKATYSLTNSEMIKAVLTNTVASY